MLPEYLITVTADDIAKGVRVSCFRCPIARAIRRTTSATVVNVGEQTGALLDPDTDATYGFTLPPSAQTFIHEFDADHPVEPFSFPLPLRAQP